MRILLRDHQQEGDASKWTDALRSVFRGVELDIKDDSSPSSLADTTAATLCFVHARAASGPLWVQAVDKTFPGHLIFISAGGRPTDSKHARIHACYFQPAQFKA